MVYNGPSRGCANCRIRKIKCDEQLPRCKNCLRKSLACAGARDASRPEFQDETLAVFQRYGKGYVKTQTSITTKQRISETESKPANFASVLVTESRATFVNYPSNGAYDPFGAFAIPIDANISELLKFWRAYVYAPTSGQSNKHLLQISSFAWQLSLDSLRDPCQAYALLINAATMHAAVTSSKRTALLATQWRNDVSKALRDYLSKGDLHSRVLGYVQFLMAAELAARNFPAATSHARFLAQMLQPRSNVPEGVYHAFLWLEIQRATATFTRPMVDVHSFEHGYDANLCLHELSGCPTGDHNQTSLDITALKDPNLRQLFIELRFYAVAISSLDKSAVSSSGMSQIQLSSSLLLLCGRLLNYGMTVSERAHGATAGGLEQFLHAQNAAASLAALYWLRLLTFNEPTKDTPATLQTIASQVYAAGPEIFSKINDLLQISETMAHSLLHERGVQALGNENLRSELRLRLWILHVGSFFEEANPQLVQLSQQQSYQMQLQGLLHATTLLYSPESIAKIVQGFLSLRKDTICAPSWLSPALRKFTLSAEH